MTPKPQTILITGAEGTVGSLLRRELAPHFRILALTRTPQDFESKVVDIRELAPLVAACRGVDAIVHCAAAAELAAGWTDVLGTNIAGTRNVFEAAREAGVPAVIFASSGHVLGRAEEEFGPALYALDHPQVFEVATPPRPDSLYAVAKIFGESLGRFYAEVHGLRVICLRLGTVLPHDQLASASLGRGRTAALPAAERYPRLRAKWLSHRDCGQLFRCALEATHVRWAVVFGTSNNPRQIWSLAPARELLGYEPQDAAPVDPP